MTRASVAAAALCAAMVMGGCESAMIDFMVAAPNQGQDPSTRHQTPAGVLSMLNVERELFIDVAEPPATIRAWMLNVGEGVEPRGTILVLHGIKTPSFWMMVKGWDLSGAGYRVVMVDLRGHGGSTGDYTTYGVVESRDLVHVIDALQREDLIAGRLGAWGISLGAATAIQLAARDDRIEAVVAVAPFTTARQAAQTVVRHFMPFNAAWSDDELDAMIDRAGQRAGFDPDEANTVDAIARTQAPVLIIGGEWDAVTPVEQSQAVHQSAPDHSELMTLPASGHLMTGIDPGWRVKAASIAWFDRHLAALDDPASTANVR